MKTLAERYAFFRANAGGIVGESAICAMRLARAEETAERIGLTCFWNEESDAWDGDVGCEAPALCLWGAVYKRDDVNEQGYPLRRQNWISSLGMVGVESYRDPYLRVVAAELFLEALSVIDGEWQIEADKLSERATYAG